MGVVRTHGIYKNTHNVIFTVVNIRLSIEKFVYDKSYKSY
ncbi:MAG: hypothetical protein H6Q70_1883 [Firmicutes bacterium]|nr:hypothetical protein [Bacillota bacterium]